MKKRILLVFLLIAGLFVPAWADDDLEDVSTVEVEEVELRDPLDLECAALEYMLAYEAYIEARTSKDPAVRSKTVQYMQDYRNAYAAFLMMLREDKLVEPNKPKNPEGWYNKKHEKVSGKKRVWANDDAGKLRKKVKEKVASGASPTEIRAFIQENMPTTPMSYVPDEDGGRNGPAVVTVNRPPRQAVPSQTPPPPTRRPPPRRPPPPRN